MTMKRIILLTLTLCCLFSGASVFAQSDAPMWEATIFAAGEDVGGVKYQEIVIGVDTEKLSVPAPPLPPEYSVSLELIDERGNKSAKKFFSEGQNLYSWVIAVDPHGNMMPPTQRKAIISWFPFQFPKGKFQIVKGYYGNGEILVQDMSETSSLEITGGPGLQYLTIVYLP